MWPALRLGARATGVPVGWWWRPRAVSSSLRNNQTALFPRRAHGTVPVGAAPLTVYFVDPKRSPAPREVTAYDGEVVLEAAHRNEVEVEGACEGGLACSTCHVILRAEDYEKFPAPSEREEDLLDTAPGLTEQSRLCCQLKLNAKKHDGIVFKLPHTTRNFYVDGHVPKPH